MLGPSSYHLKGCAPSGSELRNKRAGLLQSEGRTCTFSAVRWTGRRVERSRDMERQVGACREVCRARLGRSEEHTSELQSLMRISYAVFCLKKKNKNTQLPPST